MEAFSFGSYYPGDSAIHRLDPRTKLLLGFVFLITTLTVSGFRGLAPVAIFVVPVSYTHLDVYKRQVVSRASLGRRHNLLCLGLRHGRFAPCLSLIHIYR